MELYDTSHVDVQIAYVWILNAVTLVVVLVVHYCSRSHNSLKYTHRDFRTQMWHNKIESFQQQVEIAMIHGIELNCD